jgi:hypothetical protein
MFNVTFIGPYLGLGIFGAGVYAQRYMHARIVGRSHPLQIVRDFTGKYRDLIREDKAPLWPLVLFRTCIPLGIVLVFASIFLMAPPR